MTTTHADPLWVAYGPFQPGTVARAIRHENWALGLRTCWYCLTAYRPETFVADDGRRRRPGRGRWYCSRECSREARVAEKSAPVVQVLDDGSVLLDLRRCRGCPS